MKFSVCVFTYLLFITGLQAQNKDTANVFERKGRFVIETGFNISGLNPGTGFSVFHDGFNTKTSIGLEVGKFLSSNFMFKVRAGLISVDGISFYSFGLGGKYYIAGKIPIEFVPDFINSDGFALYGNFGIGYAVVLAPNIYLEPSINMTDFSNNPLFGLKASFVMIL